MNWIEERALLIGVDTGEEEDFDRCMEELGNLAEACNMKTAGLLTQKMPAVSKSIYLGTGKLEEAIEFSKTIEADVVLFEDALSPIQLRNLQDAFGLPVLDRTTLILDIFSNRAQTREAKLQVETARLQYFLPRLVGLHKALSRQGGASGSMSNKGSGEKKLELDRRRIEHRLAELRKELEEVSKERETQRKRRSESIIPKVSLVGYTNAGKSTLMNSLLEMCNADEEKKVFEKDMLFATLETSVRKITISDNKTFFLSDTVGFIHKLPHGLVKAFRSTLEEVKNADLLLHVIDYSDENYMNQIRVTEDTLNEIDSGGIPVIYVYNKAEVIGDMPLPKRVGNKIFLSAKEKTGLSELLDMIKESIYGDYEDAEFLIPYNAGSILSYLIENASVKEKKYVENGVHLVVNCHKSDTGRFKEYQVS